jgi:hypothetical protein
MHYLKLIGLQLTTQHFAIHKVFAAPEGNNVHPVFY